MKHKGFTLIEMLGVMALLAVIFSLIYPNAMEMLERGKKQDYMEYQRTIELAAEAYINSNQELSFPTTDSSFSITFHDLMNSGYLSTNVVNPKTKQTVLDTPNATVTVSKTAQGEVFYTLSEG